MKKYSKYLFVDEEQKEDTRQENIPEDDGISHVKKSDDGKNIFIIAILGVSVAAISIAIAFFWKKKML